MNTTIKISKELNASLNRLKYLYGFKTIEQVIEHHIQGGKKDGKSNKMVHLENPKQDSGSHKKLHDNVKVKQQGGFKEPPEPLILEDGD